VGSYEDANGRLRVITHCSSRFPMAYTTRFVHSKRPKDCYICEKYGNGPCGPLFWTWWECTEKHLDDYTTVCKNEFARFQECSDKHLMEDVGADVEEGSASAWENFVEEELGSLHHQDFPVALEPHFLQQKSFIEISLVDDTNGGSLLAAIIQRGDNDTHVIAAAATHLMMENDEGRRSLIFPTPTELDAIAVTAVYEKEDETFEVFKHIFTLQ